MQAKNIAVVIVVAIVVALAALLLGGVGMAGAGMTGTVPLGMGGGMMGGAMLGLPLMGGLLMLVVPVLVIGGLVWLVVALVRGAGNTTPTSATTTSNSTPLDILKLRYAKGEITKEQFDEMRRNLET